MAYGVSMDRISDGLGSQAGGMNGALNYAQDGMTIQGSFLGCLHVALDVAPCHARAGGETGRQLHRSFSQD